jgi:hypothetical protein
MKNDLHVHKRICIAVALALSCISCAFSELDRASAPPEDYWKKPGFPKETATMFLYKNCGYLNRPSSNDFANESDFEAAYNKQAFEIEQCMLDNGFNFSLDGLPTPGTVIWRGRCDSGRLGPSPACRSIKK